MSNEPQIKFLGSVVGGKRKYLKPIQHQKALDALEGKEFEEIICQRFEQVTIDQHGYYRSGIIRHACMESETFGGWSESDLDQHFKELFLTFAKSKTINYNGKEETIELKITESTANIGKKRMTKFIEDVLNYLASEHDIHPLSVSEYYAGKYNSK